MFASFQVHALILFSQPFVRFNESEANNDTSVAGYVKLPFNLVRAHGLETDRLQFCFYQSTVFFDVSGTAPPIASPTSRLFASGQQHVMYMDHRYTTIVTEIFC